MRRLLPLPAVLLAALALAAPASAAPSPDIVISEIYGGGGNSGATLRNDFIELFNRGTTTVDVSTWSVQYASAAGTTWQRTNLVGTIAPGQFYLVQESAGTGGTQSLPAPDATGTIAMSGTAGKVALVTNQTALTCGATRGSCSAVATVRDLIGYGATASDSEGAPAPAPSNTNADVRAVACTDTDQNAADFTLSTPAPQNTASPRTPCAAPPGDAAPRVTDTDPDDGASEVPVTTSPTVAFSEDVTVADGGFALSCTRSGAAAITVSGGPRTFTLDPARDLAVGERCTITVSAASVSDVDTDDPPDSPAADVTSSFTTPGLALRIPEIQGTAHRSAFTGERVSGVPGVVTARRSNGYYLQDPVSDGRDATSQGIFVFTGTAPPASAAVGNAVLVNGRVDEFRPGGASSDNLSTTQLSSPVTTPAGTGTVPPTLVGPGGRVPPTEVIDDDTLGDIETTMTTFDPEQDGIDFYESLEGMLTRVNDPVAVGPTSDFGEVPTLAAGGEGASIRTARGGIVIRPTDFNPERIIFDDVIADTPTVDVRDAFAGPVDAVVDYSFGNFKFLALRTPEVVDGGLEREITDEKRDDQLAIASFNVENLDALDPPEKFQRLAETLVTNLRSPDIVGVEEVQDDDGARTPAPTDASLTYARLIAAIEAEGGPTYTYRQIDPASNQDGGQPNGNIRVGFLYRTDTGVSFVDRPGGTAVNATEEDATRRGAQLTLSPGRIDPTDPAFARSRKPLAGEFRYRGRTVIAIVNHFNSKGGDDPLFGRVQPPIRSSEAQRHQQAAIVNAFVDELLAADKNARVVVFGDLNDFEFSRTLDILEGGELFNLADLLPQEERYSYVFEGNSQVLDQILVSRALMAPRPEYDSVHTNAEFADQISDHDPQLARLRITGAPVKDE